jgi:hypothetical protein
VKRIVLIGAALLTGAAVASAAHPPFESVVLAPLHGSSVTGRVTYRAHGNGTSTTVRLRGVPPGATARVLLHAGTCRAHGLSFAVVAGGRIVFHGAPVPIGVVTDGKHVFSVVVNGREVACAAIPGIR